MIYCLNPYCRDRLNPDDSKFCLSCGSLLLLRNRYHAIKPVGSGGFGRTYLAIDRDCMNMPCIVKQFSPSPDIQSEPVALRKATDMFYQEAVRLLQLGEHPQIPRLLAYFEQEKYLYLVQELIDGKDLKQELASTGAFSEQKIKQLLANLLPVLKFIHDRGVIHRDIKPGNIMRRRKDDQLVLIDFGVSKQATGTLLGKVGTKVGTAGFTPLEQMRGQAYPASDLYSLGVTCVCLLTRSLPQVDGLDEVYDPMEGRWKWRERLPKGTTVSQDLGQILDKLLQDLPKDRYQSADEVQHDLNRGNSLTQSENKEALDNAVESSEQANSDVSRRTSAIVGSANVPETSVSANEVEGSVQLEQTTAEQSSTVSLGQSSASPTDSLTEVPPEHLCPNSQPSESTPPDSESAIAFPRDRLVSAAGIDYSQLRQLLAAEEWKQADLATTHILFKVAGREQEGWMRAEDFKKFPCEDLRTIDRLWVYYSKGRFGFSIQKTVWKSVGGKHEVDYISWCRFGDRVGWRVKGNWLKYSDLTFNREIAPVGHLPAGGVDEFVLGKWDLVCCSLVLRLKECNIH
jgi:serine/threonine protein kinase